MNLTSAHQRTYTVHSTNQYDKDYKKLRKSGYRMTKLEAVIDALARAEKLPDRCRDHALKGTMAGQRECHIAPDWLLVYEKDKGKLILLLLQTGSHRDVFGIE